MPAILATAAALKNLIPKRKKRDKVSFVEEKKDYKPIIATVAICLLFLFLLLILSARIK